MPGETYSGQLQVDNLEGTRQTLRLERAIGRTAQNSGSSYMAFDDGCEAAACWIADLSGMVTIGPKETQVFPFTLTVPGDTPSGQYLAGLVVRPAIWALWSWRVSSCRFP